MKKSILAIAVAATMAASTAAVAAPTVYGNVHLSIDAFDNDVAGADNNIAMHSNTSAIGVKGSEDLGDGLKAIYKVEFGINLLAPPTPHPDGGFPVEDNKLSPEGTGALGGRDQFVGLKGGFGTVKLGTMSSNYKQMGGKVDPLYRTPLEGRGFLDMQSRKLHGGRGITNGRSTNTVQYVTPKMAGIQLVANTTLSGSNDETSGVGLRWSNKAFLVYADYISGQALKDPILTCDTANNCSVESAVKVGGKFTAKVFSLALQYEDSEDRDGANYLFGAGTWNINKNNALILTAGTATYSDAVPTVAGQSIDTTGVALAYNHKMSKMTNVYVGYGAKASDADGADESLLTVGIRKKF